MERTEGTFDVWFMMFDLPDSEPAKTFGVAHLILVPGHETLR
jgi:hypothetical protein